MASSTITVTDTFTPIFNFPVSDFYVLHMEELPGITGNQCSGILSIMECGSVTGGVTQYNTDCRSVINLSRTLPTRFNFEDYSTVTYELQNNGGYLEIKIVSASFPVDMRFTIYTGGSTGTTGSQGPTGIQGSNGIQGFTGPTGIQGFTGPTGIQGTIGSTGPTGTSRPVPMAFYFNSGASIGSGNLYLRYGTTTTTETPSQILIPLTGTLKNLYINATNSPQGSATRTITIRLANTPGTSSNPTALSAVLTGSNTSASDLVDSVSVTAGQLISVYQTTTGTGNAPASAVVTAAFILE